MAFDAWWDSKLTPGDHLFDYKSDAPTTRRKDFKDDEKFINPFGFNFLICDKMRSCFIAKVHENEIF